MVRTALVFSLFLLAFVACGGASHPETELVVPPSACVTDPAVAETRRPRPAGTGCMTGDDVTALGHACNGGDADACDRYVGCQLFGELGQAPSPATVDPARAALRIACDAGIAESCQLRVGVAMNIEGAPMPDDGCADLIRGCQLGHESSCLDCRNNACQTRGGAGQ